MGEEIDCPECGHEPIPPGISMCDICRVEIFARARIAELEQRNRELEAAVKSLCNSAGLSAPHMGPDHYRDEIEDRCRIFRELGDALATDAGRALADEMRLLRDAIAPEAVEAHLRSLPWTSDATDWEKTLVAGNVRNFAARIRDALDRHRAQRTATGADFLEAMRKAAPSLCEPGPLPKREDGNE